MLRSPPVRSRPAHRRGGLEFRSAHLLAVLLSVYQTSVRVCLWTSRSNWLLYRSKWAVELGHHPSTFDSLRVPFLCPPHSVATEKPQDVKKEDRGSHLSPAFPSCMILGSSFIHGPNGHHFCPTYFTGYSQEKNGCDRFENHRIHYELLPHPKCHYLRLLAIP